MSIDLSAVADGLANAFTIKNLIWLVFGVLCGLFAGTLPGFSGGPMMAILLPIVSTQPIDTMLITLAGIYAASVYSDSTAGILYNIPGGAAGVPATMEGYQLKQQGKLKEAFAAQIGGSFMGAVIGFVVLIFLVPTFMYIVNFFGTAERALFAVWALVLIAGGAITKEDPLKAFLSVGVGLTLAMIGQQPNIGTFRFHMGLTELWGGLKVIWVILAVFAIPQLFRMVTLRDGLKNQGGSSTREKIPFFGMYKAAYYAVVRGWKVIARSSLFGVVIGIIPGIGTTTASWVGYSSARAVSKEKEKFGKGAADGVMGAEAASNSCEVGTTIPLLSLGIPGSSGAAIMLAAFIMAGIAPGPSMYVNYGPQVWTIMFGIGMSAFVFTLLAYPFIKGAQWLSHLPIPALVGAIGSLCMLGAYVAATSLFGNIAVLALGVAMVLTGMIGLKAAPLLIGFILGSGIEMELIRAYQIGGFARFIKPTSLVILVIILITVAYSIYSHIKENALKAREAGAKESSSPEEAARLFLKEKLLGILTLILAIVLLVETLEFPLFASLWVYFVAGVFLIVPSGILLFRNVKAIPVIVKWFSAKERAPLFNFNRSSFFDQLAVLAGFVVFVATVKIVGFIVSAALFVFLIMFYFRRKFVRSLVYGVCIAAALYLMKVIYHFYIPTGIWNI